MSIKIKELPETERPYEKLELYGEKMLSNAELLAIIIKTGTKNETSVQIAQKILNMNDENTDELNFLRNISLEEFMQIKGIGKVKAIQLKAVCELAIRMSRPSNYKKVTIRQPYDLAKILMNELRKEQKEIGKIVILNSRNEIIKIKDISVGGTNLMQLGMKDILAEPVKMKAPKIILVHNHPTGNSTPSKTDIKFTERLYESAQLLGIELIDHIVIGDLNFTSIFSEMVSNTKENSKS